MMGRKKENDGAERNFSKKVSFLWSFQSVTEKGSDWGGVEMTYFPRFQPVQEDINMLKTFFLTIVDLC